MLHGILQIDIIFLIHANLFHLSLFCCSIWHL